MRANPCLRDSLPVPSRCLLVSMNALFEGKRKPKESLETLRRANVSGIRKLMSLAGRGPLPGDRLLQNSAADGSGRVPGGALWRTGPHRPAGRRGTLGTLCPAPRLLSSETNRSRDSVGSEDQPWEARAERIPRGGRSLSDHSSGRVGAGARAFRRGAPSESRRPPTHPFTYS